MSLTPPATPRRITLEIRASDDCCMTDARWHVANGRCPYLETTHFGMRWRCGIWDRPVDGPRPEDPLRRLPECIAAERWGLCEATTPDGDAA